MDLIVTHFIINKKPNKPMIVEACNETIYKQYDGFYHNKNKVLLHIPNITVNKDYSIHVDLYTNDNYICNNVHTYVKQYILNIANSIIKEL